MQFSDTSTKSGIIQECEFLVGGESAYGSISGDTNRLATFTRLINRAYDDVTAIILDSDDRWEFDDSEFTDYPIATTNLVSSQQDYVMDVTHLKVNRVEAKDQSGNWHILTPFDKNDVRGTAMTEFMDDAGIPRFYDKIANSIFLYPKPSYNSTNGLKVFFQRPPNYFATSDTTQVPGIPSIFHQFLPFKACYYYSMAQQKNDKASFLGGEVALLERKIRDFYGKRNKDEHKFMSAQPVSNE